MYFKLLTDYYNSVLRYEKFLLELKFWDQIVYEIISDESDRWHRFQISNKHCISLFTYNWLQ